MTFMKGAMLLLLLAAVGINADTDHCAVVNQTIPAKDLTKVYGDWVLVWAACNNQEGWDLLPNVSSSFVELQAVPDENSVLFIERNRFISRLTTLITTTLTTTLVTTTLVTTTLIIAMLITTTTTLVMTTLLLSLLLLSPPLLVGILKKILLSSHAGSETPQSASLRTGVSEPPLSRMMTFMKGAMLLLLAAVGTNADTDHCEGLNKTMPGVDLHKVVGDWVLIWASSNSHVISVENLTNSHVHLHLSSDNSTMIYEERNRFKDSSCFKYNASFSVASDLHKLDLLDMYVEKDGVSTPFKDSATVQFFETCLDCVVMVYNGNLGRFLLYYRREGHHQDLKITNEAYEDFKKLTGCLELSLEGSFTHKGDENFCHKTPPTKDAVEESDA
ncbi:saxitoxin and tetrodotoxin-binding protein 1-like [Halichoeres trimaculatus]|uniref:saxitoxin and tetrodotoxin-binding protein 1-like n=1 Tax=Halichoeres trimaculatus TaxID=147232 RepID=UPI003D9EAE4F